MMKTLNETSYKKILIIFSAFSLLFLIISYIPTFLTSDFTPTALIYIFFVLNFAPPIILLLSTTKFENSTKNSLLVSVAYFIFATQYLLTFILNFINTVSGLKYAFLSFINLLWFIADIITLLLPISLILAGCRILKRKFTKAAFISPLVLVVLDLFVFIIIRLIQASWYGFYAISLADFSYELRDLSLCLYLFVFAFNKIDPVKTLDKVLTSLPPEKALLTLKSTFENNQITEDEYNAKRAEIISKL